MVTTSQTEQVQVEFLAFSKPSRKLTCPLGCEYSVHPGDYWYRLSNEPFTCEHDGEQFVCSLVEQQHVQGRDAQGRQFAGLVWVVINESPTPNDLR